jgi:DUF971 family protein
MPVQPVKLLLIDQQTLAIQWSDGQWQGYDVAELRRACPCAACISSAVEPAPSQDRPAPARSENEPRARRREPVEPPIRLLQMDPVGNYAYRLRFSDGHDTGIYTLEVLRRRGWALAKDVEASLK